MKQTVIATLIISGLFSQSPSDATRLYEMETGFGNRALAMGNAYTALADDISGLYWNPAGIGQINKSVFTIDLSHGLMGNRTSYLGAATTADHSWTKLNSLGIVYPFEVARGALAWGLSFQRIGDSERVTEFSGFSAVPNTIVFTTTDGTESAFDRNVTRTELIRLEGGIDQWSTGVSIAIAPHVLVGATVAINSGNDTYHFQFQQADTDHQYETFPEDYDRYDIERYLQTEFNGLEVKLGGLMTAGKMQFGGMVSLPYRYAVKEVYTEQEIMNYDDGTFETIVSSDPGQWTYSVKSPFQLNTGVAYKSKRLTVGFSTTYMDWSQVKFDVSDLTILDDDYLALLENNETIRSTYRSTLDLHLGAEMFIVPNLFAVQGGWMVKPSNISGKADRQIISGGIRLFPDSAVDMQLSYQLSSWDHSSSDEFTPTKAGENVTQSLYRIGFNYRF